MNSDDTDVAMSEPAATGDHVASRGATFAAVALLLLLPVALLWPSLLGREAYLPFSAAQFPPFAAELTPAVRAEIAAHANMDVTEIPITFVPELTHVRAELAAGRLPYWNPYARFGAALLSTSVVGLMYPPNWLTFLLADPTRGLGWNAYLALAIAGLLMFGFLRALGLGSLAAAFGAVAFAASGTITANLHFYQRVHALVWLPGMLWALTLMQQRDGHRRRRAGVGLALCLAMSWLAGFPAYAASATLIAVLWAILLLAVHAGGAGWRAALHLAGSNAVCAGLGMALAAVQLLPMFAFFPESNRDPDPTPDSIASQAFDPMGFVGYVLPDAFGTPARPELPYEHSLPSWMLFSRASWQTGATFHPNFNFVEYTVYPGALVLLLAVLGLLAARGRGRVFAAVGLAGLWVLACAGPHTAAINDLPFVRSVPPMRFMGPACLLVALLAAYGLERAAQAAIAARVVAGGALVLVAACVVGRWVLGTAAPDAWLAHATPHLIERYHPRFPNASPELIQSLLGGDYVVASLDQVGRNLNYAVVVLLAAGVWLVLAPLLRDRRRWLVAVQILALVATGVELLVFAWPVNRGRLDVPLSAPALDLLRAARDQHAAAGGFTVARGALSPELPTALPPCLLVPERIRDLHAYTFVDARSHRLFVELYGPDHMIRGYWPMAFPDDERLQRPLFDLLGVRYVLSTAAMKFAGRLVEPSGGDPSFRVYERDQAMPRAFVVPRWREVPDEDAVVAAMVAKELRPRTEVLVTPEQAAGLGAPAGGVGAEQRAVRFEVDTPSEVKLTVDAGPPGYLVVSDALMRGWQATVAGSTVPVHRGNLFMRVLPVGADRTEVRFTYTPPRLLAGAAVTGLALAALLFLACHRPRRRERSAPGLGLESALPTPEA